MMIPPRPGKNAAQRKAYTGIFAVHDIKGMRRMVSLRSRSEGNVRVDITAGTEHPKPTSMGTTLRPESPRRRSRRSMTNAMRAMYPESSSSERKKKRSTIMGMKLTTAPTPAHIPSVTRLCTTSLICMYCMTPDSHCVKASTPCPKTSCNHAPRLSKVRKKTSAMMPKKAGKAVSRPVSTRSMARLLRCSRLSRGFTTHLRQRALMKE